MSYRRLLDPRVAIAIISTWLIIVVILMFSCGFITGTFFRFGPGPNVKFFGVVVDDWGKYMGIVLYTVFNQIVQTYGLETITPWMLNVIQNRKVEELAVSPVTVQMVIQLWYLFLWSGRIVGIQILLAQFDFLLIILVSDLATTFVTTRWYLMEKIKSII